MGNKPAWDPEHPHDNIPPGFDAVPDPSTGKYFLTEKDIKTPPPPDPVKDK